MHAGVAAKDFDGGSQFPADAFQQNVRPLSVEHAHAADVTREMTFADEIRKYVLKKSGRSKIHGAADFQKTIDQVARNDQVAQAQRRKQYFAEGADVDHAGIGIQALQGCNGHASVAIVAVVVVLDDPGAGTLRPVQQLQAAGGAHGYA